MCDWPSKAPEALPDGDSPACLTSDDELSYRQGSPVSAKIAAAPTAVSPGMSASRDRPRSPSTATMSASTARSWARVRCRSPSSSAQRRSSARRWDTTTPSVLASAANTARHTRLAGRWPPYPATAWRTRTVNSATPMAASFSGCPPHRDVTTCIAASQVTDSNG
jgi:hypothetical protein